MPLRIIVLFTASLMAAQVAFSQNISNADRKILRQKEDSLTVLARNMILDSLTAGRMRSDSMMVRTLIRALQVKHSFYYPFDSLQGVSKIYSPDSSFRILSWNLSFDDYYSRQRAAIQFRTRDGSLRMVPLRDYSEFTARPMDSVRTRNNWIGAVYYRIIHTEHNGRDYYTLLGFDDNSVRSNKKWIEVMSFNERMEPVFGGPFFSFAQDSVPKPDQYRHYIEYKKDARAVVEYDEEMQLIILDHLVSESDEPELKYTYVPDGDVEAFQWKNGKWLHIDKLFDFKLQDGEFPMPNPLRDDKGNPDLKKLEEQSEKNKAKKKG